MEDILQEAIVQTIPEVIAEVTQEVWEEQERLALQHAQVLVEGAMPQSEEARSLAASLGRSAGAPRLFELSEVPQTSEAEETMVVGSSEASGTAVTEGGRGEEGGSMEVSVQVEPTPGGGETAAEDSEEERLKDQFIQGTIAPKHIVVQ